jgi:hypothetical protein
VSGRVTVFLISALDNKDRILKISAKFKPLLAVWLPLVGLAALLAACGGTPGQSPALTPPDKPCVIVEFKPQGTNGLGKESPTTLVLDRSSPDYCQNVRADYKAAMVWYQSQVANNTYAPAMNAELANYYTGQLLNDARAGLFYNKEAGRVVLGRFNPQNQSISDQKWAKDGYSTTLVVSPGNYSLVSFKADAASQAQETKSGPFESWEVTMVYDAGAGHWKISAAKTVYSTTGG